MPQLKVLSNTIFKLRPLQSSELPDQEECPVGSGKIFELAEYSLINDHIKVKLSDPLASEFKGQRIWYVYSGHAQVMKGDKPVVITDYRLQILKETPLKLYPVQSVTLAAAEKYTVAAGTLLNLHSHSVENDHIKVAFADCSFQGRNTWYVYKEHAQVLKNGTVLSSSNSKILTESDYTSIAAMLGIEVAALKAVVSIESGGSGFLANGKPKVLFEAHYFSDLTDHIYDLSHPDISSREWNPDLYADGSGEHNRLERAKALNVEAALKSASWGLPQIMGENFAMSGYENVVSFVKDMHDSEGKQLRAMANFIKSQGSDAALRKLDWASFARLYNGPSYLVNAYDTKLKNAYAAFSKKP